MQVIHSVATPPDGEVNIIKDKKYCLYMHTNKYNDKKYIGVTDNIKRRWSNKGERYKPRKNGHSLPFYNAIKKYGWDNFKHDIILEDLSLEEVSKMEKEYIFKYKTLDRNFGYNCSSGGSNGNNFASKTQEEMIIIKQKISKGNKHKIISKETRKKLSVAFSKENNPFYGKNHTEETKTKLSEARKGIFVGENHPMYGKRGEDNPNFGKRHSNETLYKMSIANKGEKNHMYGKKHSEEARRKISQKLKGENHPLYGKKHSEETRKKMSENHAYVKRENHPRSIKAICLSTGEIFNCIRDGAEKYNIKHSGDIGACCRGKQKSAGKHPITGEPLKWMYYKDYIKTQQDGIIQTA